MRIIINTEKCSGCGECVASCSYSAIEIKGENAFINEDCQFCRMCLSVCSEGAIVEIAEDGDKQKAGLSEYLAAYRGVWVFAEQRDRRIASVAYELLGAGRRLADELNTELAAVLFGTSEDAAKELISWGADKVYHCGDPIFEKFNDEPYAQMLTKLIKDYKPAIVLAGATPLGRSFIPRVA